VYDVSGDIDLFGGDGKAATLVVEAYTGRSSKPRAHRGLQRGTQSPFPVKQERVMAFDPVSGFEPPIILSSLERTYVRTKRTAISQDPLGVQ
jgi:hypothetical protein